jgi:hypothetical protein
VITNVGVIDRTARLALGVTLLAWVMGYFGAPPGDLVAWPLGALGAFLAGTGLLRYCPLLALAGESTCADEI